MADGRAGPALAESALASISLPQRVDLGNVAAVAVQALNQLQALCAEGAGAGGRSLLVDASSLQTFDSGALAMLLGLVREAARRQVPLEVTGLSPRLIKLASLYGIADLLMSKPAIP